MKKMFSIAMLVLATLVQQHASAQELQEIVTKHIEAIGGADAWKKVNALKTQMVMKAQGAEIKITMNQVHKKAMRVDIDVMGMSGYQIVTNNEGWSYMPFQGLTKPEPMTAEDVKSSQEDLEIHDEFLSYKDAGKSLELIGKDDVEGTECFKLVMTDKENKPTTFFIDPSTYHVIKKINKKSANGKEYDVESTYANYKKLEQGIVVAMIQSSEMGEMEATSIEVNPQMHPSLFEAKSLSELK
jgi:hypothetical protein